VALQEFTEFVPVDEVERSSSIPRSLTLGATAVSCGLGGLTGSYRDPLQNKKRRLRRRVSIHAP
jgi:hypothetical protein